MNLSGTAALFRRYLHARGLRYTPEREEILGEIFSHERHFDADELYLRLKKKNSRVSRATVYRCLRLLERCHLVKQSSLGQRHSHYELIYKRRHHDHLICSECGAVVEFCDRIIEERQIEICNKRRFTLTNHHLQIFGICPACRKKHVSIGENRR